MKFRYGLVGNLFVFGGSVGCVGYFAYLLLRSMNTRIDRETMRDILNKEQRRPLDTHTTHNQTVDVVTNVTSPGHT